MKYAPRALAHALLALILLNVSCAWKKPQRPLPALETLDIPVIVQELEEMRGSVSSVKGFARVRIVNGGEKVSFRQATIAREPNMLHLQVLAPFGRTAGMLISDGREAHLITRSEHLVYASYDDFDLAVLYTGLPVGIGIEELVALLLARPAGLWGGPSGEEETYEPSFDSGLLLLTPTGAGGRVTGLWLDPWNMRLRKAVVRLDDGGSATYGFSKYVEDTSGLWFPTRISFEIEDYSIAVSYASDVELNSPLDPSLFEPPGD